MSRNCSECSGAVPTTIQINLGEMMDSMLAGARGEGLYGIRAARSAAECVAAGGVVKKPPPFASPEVKARGFVCALPPTFSGKRAGADLAGADEEFGVFARRGTCPPGLVERELRPDELPPTFRGRVPPGLVRCVSPGGMRGLGQIQFAPPVFDANMFVLGFFGITPVTRLGAILLKKTDVLRTGGVDPLLTKIATTVAAGLTHYLAGPTSLTFGWMLGELQDVIGLGVERLADVIAAPAEVAGMEGIVGRRFGFEQGGIIGRRFGFEQGQATPQDVELLRRLKERLETPGMKGYGRPLVVRGR